MAALQQREIHSPLPSPAKLQRDGHGEETGPCLHPQTVPRPQGSLPALGDSTHHPIHHCPSSPGSPSLFLWLRANASPFVLLPGKHEHLERGEMGDAGGDGDSRAPIPPSPAPRSVLGLSMAPLPFMQTIPSSWVVPKLLIRTASLLARHYLFVIQSVDFELFIQSILASAVCPGE